MNLLDNYLASRKKEEDDTYIDSLLFELPYDHELGIEKPIKEGIRVRKKRRWTRRK
jgi:hypothetical protein